jgi:hypothetical protein
VINSRSSGAVPRPRRSGRGRPALARIDRVVRRADDGPVVVQEGIGDAGQAPFRLVIVGQHRLATEVARGHDQGRVEITQQQVMQWTVGQHHTELAQAWRQQGGQGTGIAAARQHDGPCGALQQGPGRIIEFDAVSKGLHSIHASGGKHHRQGLVGSLLAGTQGGDGGIIAGITHQVIAAHTLDGQHGMLAQGIHGGAQGVFIVMDKFLPRYGEAQSRSTGGAGQGFGMEAAVGGIAVFRRAVRAQGKARQGRVGPVVGQGADQGVTRTALGTVGEGVAVATLSGILNLRDAVRAGEIIGRQMNARRMIRMAGADLEIRQGFQRQGLLRTQPGMCQWWCLLQQITTKGRDGRRVTLHPDLHLPEPVAYPAPQAMPEREPVDKGPETHALHPALEDEAHRVRGLVLLILHSSLPASLPVCSVSSPSWWRRS